MGLFDRAKRFLGISSWDEDEREGRDLETAGEDAPASPDTGAPRAASLSNRNRKRPPLAEAHAQQASSKTVEEALAAREAGDHALARSILDEIDRGGGLRTLLRAAAALEAQDNATVKDLLPTLAREEPRWRLLLQIGAALGDAATSAPYLARAEQEGAPPWAIAWTRAVSADETTRRHGLVELLFTDAALARTVAARDLDVSGAETDVSASQRYASFAHGRDSIRRFGASVVAKVLDRATGGR